VLQVVEHVVVAAADDRQPGRGQRSGQPEQVSPAGQRVGVAGEQQVRDLGGAAVRGVEQGQPRPPARTAPPRPKRA
jgi:hypothetical protein